MRPIRRFTLGVTEEISGHYLSVRVLADFLDDVLPGATLACRIKPDGLGCDADHVGEVLVTQIVVGEVFGKLHDGPIVQHSVGLVNNRMLRAICPVPATIGRWQRQRKTRRYRR